MGDGVTLVSSAEETAKDVYALLVREGLERDLVAARAGARLPDDRPARGVRDARPPVPRPRGRVGRPVLLGGRGMKLTVIGCAGSFPGPDSPASCYLVEAPFEGRTYRLLIDLGSGALGNLQRECDLRDIDAIALSHLHADHCFDLSGFYVVSKYHPDGALDRIPVLAPAGAGDHLATAYGIDEPVGMTEQFDFRDWQDGGTVELGPFTVTLGPRRPPGPGVRHPGRHRGPLAGLLRRHRPDRGARRARRRRRPVPVRGVVRRVRRQPAQPAPHRCRGRRRTRPGPASVGCS